LLCELDSGDRGWRTHLLDWAVLGGLRQDVREQRVSRSQHDRKSGNCACLGEDAGGFVEEGPLRPHTRRFGFKVQRMVIRHPLAFVAQNCVGANDAAEPDRGVRVIRMEIRVARPDGFVESFFQSFGVIVRRRAEQIVERPRNSAVSWPTVRGKNGKRTSRRSIATRRTSIVPTLSSTL
jgi:hypothetical protein